MHITHRHHHCFVERRTQVKARRYCTPFHPQEMGCSTWLDPNNVQLCPTFSEVLQSNCWSICTILS